MKTKEQIEELAEQYIEEYFRRKIDSPVKKAIVNDFHNAYLMGREEGQKIAELYQPVNGYHPVAYLHLDDIKGLGYDGSELDENDLRSLAINLGEKLNYDYGEFLRELCRDELKLKKL